MDTYERDTIGSIILMKNIVFQNANNKKNELDHSWQKGRPCIIIYSDEEYDYFLPITSNISNPKFYYHYVPLSDDNLLYKDMNLSRKYNINKLYQRKTEGYINLETIYRTPISWHDEIGKVNFNQYKFLIQRLREYYKGKNLNELFEEAKIIKGRS